MNKSKRSRHPSRLLFVMIPRKYVSGASKRKMQQKHEDFKNKLPKLTNFFTAETKTGDTIVNESDDKIQQISVLSLNSAPFVSDEQSIKDAVICNEHSDDNHDMNNQDLITKKTDSVTGTFLQIMELLVEWVIYGVEIQNYIYYF